MFRVFQEEKLITACMFAFLGGSILFRVFLGLLYRNMIKEADNMATTKNRLLKQCKTKFASCYQLGNGVANIPVFVDKFLNRMALGHLSFETIYHLSGQMMLLSVVFSGIGVCKCIIGGRTVGDVMPFYIVSFFGLYIYFSVSTVVDVRGKRRVLKINLVDYLENHLSPRIDVTRQDMEMLYGEAVFEEKRLPYGRVPGGRNSKGRSRKRGKAVPVRQEKKRTVELMPIENRMAVGGEVLREGSPAEQMLWMPQRGWGENAWQPEGSQQMVQRTGTESEPQMRGMPATESESQMRGMPATESESQMRGMPGTEFGSQTRSMVEAESGSQMRGMPGTEAGPQMRGMSEAESEQQMGSMPETEVKPQMRGMSGTEADPQMGNMPGTESGSPMRGMQGTRTAPQLVRRRSLKETSVAESTQQMTQMSEWEDASQKPWPESAEWVEQNDEINTSQKIAQKCEASEDTTAVTEEELEALLKEFLTT